MNFIRKISENKLTLGLVLILFIFSSCSRDVSSTISARDYTGEEIVKGLFFFQNDISDKIEFLREFKVNLKKNENYYQTDEELKSMAELSIKYIKENKPSFLGNFRDVIYSGNYFEINSKMNECVQLITEALQSSEKYGDAMMFANKVKNNEKLIKFVTENDLTSTEGKEKFKEFLLENPDLQYNSNNLKVAVPIFWGAAAVVYVAAAVVSIAAAVYSVYVKVAYWSVEESSFQALSQENTVTKEIAVREIAHFFNHE